MKGALALVAMLAFAPAQEEVKLQWKPKLNEPVNLQMKLSMAITGAGDIDVNFIVHSKVVKMDDETVTTESKLSDFKFMFNGQEMDMSGQGGPDLNETSTMVQKRNGEIVSMSGAEMQGGERTSRMNAFHWPDKGLKIGESWEHEWKADKAKGLPHSKAKWTLSAHEMKNNVDCYKVDYVFAEMDDPNGISASGSVWLAAADNTIIYGKYQFNNVSFQEGMPPTNGTGELIRLKN